MEPVLSRYIWRHTHRQQIFILCFVALSMVPYFMSFNLPKQIVNGPIQGTGFETVDATQVFMRLSVNLPGLGDVLLFPGIPLDRLSMLFALSGVFLALVIVNGLFKYFINTYKGRLGERLLRRIRFDLIDRILRFPPNAFKRMKGAEVASMVKDEVEPLGGFAGESFVTPALLGGQALTALAFIFVQSVPLGALTAAIVAVQALLIPRLRRRLLILGRERQLTARQLAGRVSEIVDGIHTIRAYDTSNYERADIAARLGRIFKIRYDIYQWKFLVKFINNFLASVTPFLFYAVGGWLALNGQLDVGQLVAVIAAYKDLPGPLKELIDWDQARQDVQVKYATVVGQFAVEPMIDPAVQAVVTEDAAARFTPPLATQSLGVTDDGGATVLERVNLTFAPHETVALVGDGPSGADVLAETLARITWPTQGRILAGEADLAALPDAVMGRALTYVASDSYLLPGTILENLLYGLKHAPLRPPAYDAAAAERHRWAVAEARRAANPTDDPEGDWIDYAAAGVPGPEGLPAAVREALDVAGLTKEAMDLALRSSVDPAQYGDLATRIVDLRRALGEALVARDLDGLVVPFEPMAYNPEATVLENLLFGSATGPDLHPDAIGKNPWFRKVLDEQGLTEALAALGQGIAETTVELFGDLPPDHPVFQQMTAITASDLPALKALLARIESSGLARITEADRLVLIRLSFDYIEPRLRFGLINSDLAARIVAFRQAFHTGLPPALAGSIEMYHPDRYITSASLLDNMLFGRITQKYRDGAERIYQTVAALLPGMNLQERVLQIGLDFEVGTAGKRLSIAQRQRLTLARAVLRRSVYFVFNRPVSALDPRAQEATMRAVLAHLSARESAPAVIWVLGNAALAPLFDRIVVLEKGQVVGDGTYVTLREKSVIFKELTSA